jgi:hypothetical protein
MVEARRMNPPEQSAAQSDLFVGTPVSRLTEAE